jgi:histidinol-phosphate/aromatic aminotransferase/cobyric acid decarboxylase-like protein
MLAVIAARAAVQDSEYIAKYVGEVLAARELAYVGFERLGSSTFPVRRTSCCFSGDRAIPLATPARARRAGARPQLRDPGCVRVTIGTGAGRALPRRVGDSVEG